MTSSKRHIVVWLLALLVMAATVFALASVNSATTYNANAQYYNPYESTTPIDCTVNDIGFTTCKSVS